jgi:hypothetical protein
VVKDCCGGSRRLRKQPVRSSGGGRKLYRWSKVVVEVAGSSGGGRELWRWQEALEAVEGCGEGQRLWGRSLRVGIIEELAQVDDIATIAW